MAAGYAGHAAPFCTFCAVNGQEGASLGCWLRRAAGAGGGAVSSAGRASRLRGHACRSSLSSTPLLPRAEVVRQRSADRSAAARRARIALGGALKRISAWLAARALQAFQVSAQCVKLWREGWFQEGAEPSGVSTMRNPKVGVAPRRCTHAPFSALDACSTAWIQRCGAARRGAMRACWPPAEPAASARGAAE